MMTVTTSKIFALVFVACALQFTALADSPLMGKLRTRDNKPVMVNSHQSTSGTTVLSGSQIQCPEKTGATIDLGELGRIDMAPKSDITLSFNASSISVQLRAGYVVLTTSKGIKGNVMTPEGKVVQTDSSKTSSVVAKTKGAEGPETAVGARGGMGAGKAIGVAGAGAAVVGGAAAAKSNGRGGNLSSDNPRRP
jgi:hypothetical protein